MSVNNLLDMNYSYEDMIDYFSCKDNLAVVKFKPGKKIQAHDPCDYSAVLKELSYQFNVEASHVVSL